MRLARLLSTTVVVGVVAAATFFACGGDDGGGNNTDAFVYLDGKVYLDAPGSGSGSGGLGTSCTPSMDGSGQGTCPPGYSCLVLTGGSGPWCSKMCTRGAGDMCSQGYTGPGVANCMWDVTFGSGSAVFQMCGVICEGTSACGSGSACDGTCPGSMTCNYTIMSGSNAIGSACK